MKKTNLISLSTLCILLLTMLVFCIPSAFADRDTFVTGSSPRVSMISQDPDPVEPGDYVELRWMITNMGSTPIEDLEFMLVADYPFELLGADDGIKYLGTIQGNQKGEEGVVLHYRVRINDDASEGINKLYLKYRHKNQKNWVKLEYFDVRVQSVDAAVIINSVKLEPSRIPAGNDGKLTLKISNLADSEMKDVNVKLDLLLSSISTTDASSLYDTLPFAPTSSSSEKRISNLKAGESKSIVYDLTIYPDAESRVYKLPVLITYRDELDTEYSKEEVIGITVGSEPDIYVVIDSSDLLAGRKSGSVSFKFVNRGVTDIKFLDVTLRDTSDYEIISAQEEYIGNIDSDDFESIDFSVYLNNNVDAKSSHDISFPLHMEFKDANNVHYSQDVTLNHKIYTATEIGAAQSSNLIFIVGAIIVIIIVWVVYRRIMKKKNRQ